MELVRDYLARVWVCVCNSVNCKVSFCFGVMKTDCSVWCVCVFIKLRHSKKKKKKGQVTETVYWKYRHASPITHKCACMSVQDLNRQVYILTLLTLSPLHGWPASQLHQASHSSTALSPLCINASGRVRWSNQEGRKSEDKWTAMN